MVCCFGPDTERHFDSEAYPHANSGATSTLKKRTPWIKKKSLPGGVQLRALAPWIWPKKNARSCMSKCKKMLSVTDSNRVQVISTTSWNSPNAFPPAGATLPNWKQATRSTTELNVPTNTFDCSWAQRMEVSWHREWPCRFHALFRGYIATRSSSGRKSGRTTGRLKHLWLTDVVRSNEVWDSQAVCWFKFVSRSFADMSRKHSRAGDSPKETKKSVFVTHLFAFCVTCRFFRLVLLQGPISGPRMGSTMTFTRTPRRRFLSCTFSSVDWLSWSP